MADVSSTLKERGAQYGDFTEQSDIAQLLKRAMRATPGWKNLKPFQQEALELIQMKASRVLNGNPNNFDSWHDIAGYAQLVADRLKP